MLLAIAVLLMALPGLAIAMGSDQPAWPILLRVGVALFAVWLALPELGRVRMRQSWPWWVGLGAVLLMLVARPKLAGFALLALLAATFVNLAWLKFGRALFNSPTTRK